MTRPSIVDKDWHRKKGEIKMRKIASREWA